MQRPAEVTIPISHSMWALPASLSVPPGLGTIRPCPLAPSLPPTCFMKLGFNCKVPMDVGWGGVGEFPLPHF